MLESIAWLRARRRLVADRHAGGPPPELLPKLRGLLDDMRGEESWPNRCRWQRSSQ